MLAAWRTNHGADRVATGLLLAAALGGLGVLGCGSTAPILLHPKMPNAESTTSSPARIDVAFDDIAMRRTLHTAIPLTAK